MKWLLCAILVPLVTALVSADQPKQDAKKEVVISFPVTTDHQEKGGNIAESLRVGSLVNIVIEEPGARPARTVFEARRVSAIAEHEKTGLIVSVYLTPAQAKAFEALKAAGTVKLELSRDFKRFRFEDDKFEGKK